MTNLVLEIFSEEIPALMQKAAAENLTKIANEIFAKHHLLEDDMVKVTSYVTPRRLALLVSGLKEEQLIPEVKKVGPRINADIKAIAGFCKSVGVTDAKELGQIDNNGNTCYYHVKPESKIKTTTLLKPALEEVMQKMINNWPKLMRWDVAPNKQAQWIRPIRNLLCLFGSEVVNVEFANLQANDSTYSHRALGDKTIKIDHATNYEETLKKNYIIINHATRKNLIIEQIQSLAQQLNLKTIDDLQSNLFDEVTGLCEYPSALVANIDNQFMSLPKEILILTLKLNQRYFCLKDTNDQLSQKFIFINNTIDGADTKKIISDNEKLVTARLSDAKFFVEEDLKYPLISRLEQLKQIILHQKLGSVYDKTKRLFSAARFISVFVPHCDIAAIKKVVDLCKADLVTKAVAELPELQGKIGSFYCSKQGENQKISEAIYEHYLPLGPNSQLPQSALGVVLAISDKIDSICGLFLANEKPTSSKDPYALRRSALGIIRIILHYNLSIPLITLIERSLASYPIKLSKSLLQDSDNFTTAKKELVLEITKFFIDRLRSYLKDNESMRSDVVNLVLDDYTQNLNSKVGCNIVAIVTKIRFINDFVSNDKNLQLIALYKRSANIVTIEEKKDNASYDSKPHLMLFSDKYEKQLYLKLKKLTPKFKKLVKKSQLQQAFELLNQLELPLTEFFDNVQINDQNKTLRENRLTLLAQIRSLFTSVADLSKLTINN